MLSLPKILLVLAVVVVVALLSKSLRGRGNKDDDDNSGQGDTEGSENEALDLQKSAVCGDFVSEGGQGCERADCPYPV